MKRILNILAFLLVFWFMSTSLGYAQAYTIFEDYDLDSTSYVYCDTTDVPATMTCSTGTAAADGWVTKGYNEHMGVSMEIDQINVTGGVDFRIEARFINDDGSTYSDAIAIWPADGAKNKTSATGSDDEIQLVPDHVYQIRVGIKIGTADDGDDSGANAEQISVIVNQYR